MSGSGEKLETVYQKWLRRNGLGPDGKPSPQVMREKAKEEYPLLLNWIEQSLASNEGFIKLYQAKVDSHRFASSCHARQLIRILANVNRNVAIAIRNAFFSVDDDYAKLQKYRSERVSLQQLMLMLDQGDTQQAADYLTKRINGYIAQCNRMIFLDHLSPSQEDVKNNRNQAQDIVFALEELDPTRAESLQQKMNEMIEMHKSYELVLLSFNQIA